MKKLLLLIVGLSTFIAFGQAVFEPASSTVYDLLNRLSVKGIIVFNDELKPLTRVKLFNKLLEAEAYVDQLTLLEKEEIQYFKKDFALEFAINARDTTMAAKFFEFDSDEFRFYSYISENFKLNIDPILGMSVRRRCNEVQTHRWNGLQFYGYYKNDWGFDFYFRDNEENGERIDKTKEFTKEPGINISQGTTKSIEYVDVQGSVSYLWNNGNVSIGKKQIEWGSGINGKLIFSDKAPSFPFIRLEFKPIDWLKFTYFHGWLHSALLDSSTIRKTLVDDRDSYSQREKYIAAHMISLYPMDNLSVSLGESIVYSDHLEFAYFVPILFFRMVDHYIDNDSSNTGDNAQLFFNAVYKNSDIGTKFYTTIFIDELSITNLLKGTNLSAVGITAGLSIIDPLLENSELNFEYTRLNPFVYMNSNDAQLFTSHKYQLGHWIGSNAHQIYVEYKQSFFRGLRIKIWCERIQKGQKELPEEQYLLPYPKFLYGERLTRHAFGIQIQYETFRNLVGKISYTYTNTSDQNILRTPLYQLGKKNSFELSLGYGF